MKASSIVKQNILYPSYILFYEDYKNPPMEKFVRNGKVSAVGLSRIARTKLCLALHRGEQWQAPHAWKTEDNTRGVSIVSTTVHPPLCTRTPFPSTGTLTRRCHRDIGNRFWGKIVPKSTEAQNLRYRNEGVVIYSVRDSEKLISSPLRKLRSTVT